MSEEPVPTTATGSTLPPGKAAGLDVLAAAVRYNDEELRLPPVPQELGNLVRELRTWEWGTLDTELTDRDAFVTRALDPATPDSIAFGYMGHGVASWWIGYQIVLGPLAVFCCQGYGGPYGDEDRDQDKVNATLTDIEEVIVLAKTAADEGDLSRDQRLLVLIDDRGGSGWGITGATEQWYPSDEPLAEALEYVGA
jgi:hypothetical protein